jgi:hypothetical protein
MNAKGQAHLLSWHFIKDVIIQIAAGTFNIQGINRF